MTFADLYLREVEDVASRLGFNEAIASGGGGEVDSDPAYLGSW